MGIVWDIPPEEALNDLANAYEKAIRDAAFQLAQRWAPEIESWMKANKKWEDRTANAVQTLEAEAERVANELIDIVLTHGVEYGWYLEGINPATMAETRQGGKYAIIGPAIDYFAPKIWEDVVALLS